MGAGRREVEELGEAGDGHAGGGYVCVESRRTDRQTEAASGERRGGSKEESGTTTVAEMLQSADRAYTAATNESQPEFTAHTFSISISTQLLILDSPGAPIPQIPSPPPHGPCLSPPKHTRSPQPARLRTPFRPHPRAISTHAHVSDRS